MHINPAQDESQDRWAVTANGRGNTGHTEGVQIHTFFIMDDDMHNW